MTVLEIRPRRVAVPHAPTKTWPNPWSADTTGLCVDLDLQGSSVANALPAQYAQDEATSGGTTRMVRGHSGMLAVAFDGSGYVELGTGIAFRTVPLLPSTPPYLSSLANTFSVAVEFRADSLADGTLFGWFKTTAPNQDRFAIGLTAAGHVKLTLGSGSATSSSTTYSADRWHSILVSCTENGTSTDFVVYLDGVSIMTGTSSYQLSDDAPTYAATLKTVLGSGFAGTSFVNGLTGRIGRVLVWGGVALDSSDATDLRTLFTGPIVVHDSDSTIPGAHGCLSEISPVAQSLDPSTRAYTPGQFDAVLVDDGLGRYVSEVYRVGGIHAGVWLGFADLDLDDDFEPISQASVIDQPLADDGLWMLRLSELTMPTTIELVEHWLGHPSEICEEALKVGGFPRSFYDPSSMTASAAGATKSHLQATRPKTVSARATTARRPGNIGRAIKWTPENAYDLITDLLGMSNASLIPKRRGKLAIQYYDATAAAVDSWDESDILSPLEKPEDIANLATQLQMSGPEAATARGNRPVYDFIAEAEAAQNENAIGGLWPRLTLGPEIVSEWPLPNAFRVVSGDLTGAGPWTIVVRFAPGWTGTGLARAQRVRNTGTQAAGYAINSGAGRYGYIALGYTASLATQNPHLWDTVQVEFARVSAIAAYPTWTTWVGPRTNPFDGAREYYPGANLTLTIDQREVLGTTRSPLQDPADVPKLFAYDATLPVIRAQAIFDRFSNGAPILRTKTGLKKLGLELGDPITISHRAPAIYQAADLGGVGVGTSHVWEIIGKEVAAQAGEITWTLCWMRED